MHNTGLLLLTGHLRTTVDSIGQYLKSIHKNVLKSLYIKLEPDLNRPLLKSESSHLSILHSCLPIVYSEASALKNVDVRLLLNSFKHSKTNLTGSKSFDIVFTNCTDDKRAIKSYISSNFNFDCSDIIILDDKIKQNSDLNDVTSSEYKTFKTVCLGGTFDRLHNGHKLLLSECVLRSTEKIIVGVSDGVLVQRKVLSELVEPLDKRMQDVFNFLSTVDPTLEYDIVPLHDTYGPTITDPSIDCLVVTTETKAGGVKVNVERKKRGMNEAYLHILDVVENKDHLQAEDEKLSSSTQRMRLLGTALKTKTELSISKEPLIVILKGHFVSDKGVIAQSFQDSGIPVLCCDEIAKTILEKSDFKSTLPEEFVALFPDNPSFERIQLICFKEQQFKEWLKKELLNKIKTSLKQVLDVYLKQGTRVLIVKDSTLFEDCNLDLINTEVWSAILPSAVILQKLKNTFNLEDAEASEIAKTLPSNEHYVKMSNMLFSNQWSSEYTQTQIDRALDYIKYVTERK